MSSRPMRMRAAVQDGVTEVRVLMSHPMETGYRRDASGAPIAAHFITDFTATHNGRVVLSAQFGPAVSADPYLAFRFKGGASGDTVVLSWIDNRGEQQRDEVQIR